MSGGYKYREGENGIIEVIPDNAGYDDVYSDQDLTDAEKKNIQFLRDMNQAEGEGTLFIHRVSGGHNGRMEFCEKMPLDKYDFYSLQTFIKEKYGPGDYRLQARVTGKKGAAGNTLITIARGTELAPTTGTALVPAGRDDDKNSLIAFMQNMQAEQARNMERLLDRLEGRRGGFMDKIKDMNPETLALITPLLAPVIEKLAGRMFSGSDPMKQLQSMLAITGDIRDLRQDNEKTDDSWSGAINAIFSNLGGMLEKQPQKQRLVQPQKTEPEKQQIKMHPMAQAFSGHLQELVNISAQNINAESEQYEQSIQESAAAVMKSVPPQFAERFRDFMEAPDCLQQLMAMHRGVFTNLQWFIDLRDTILASYDEGGEGSGEGEGHVSDKAGPDPDGHGEQESEQ